MHMTKTVRDPIHPEPFLSYIFPFQGVKLIQSIHYILLV